MKNSVEMVTFEIVSFEWISLSGNCKLSFEIKVQMKVKYTILKNDFKWI